MRGGTAKCVRQNWRVRPGPELSSASRKLRLEVRGTRPRSWATDEGLHVIPTKWVNVNKGPVEIVWEKLKHWANVVRNVCINGTAAVRDVHSLRSAHLETRGATDTVKLKRPVTWRLLPPEVQGKGENMIGELLNSLHGHGKQAHNLENVATVGFVIGTWSPAIMCCRKRELCGLHSSSGRHRWVTLASGDSSFDVQKCDDESEVHVHQPRCAASGESGTFHGRCADGALGHAHMSGSMPCGSWQARTGDLGCLPRRARLLHHGVNLSKPGVGHQAREV